MELVPVARKYEVATLERALRRDREGGERIFEDAAIEA